MTDKSRRLSFGVDSTCVRSPSVSQTSLESARSLWDYAVDIYGRPGMSDLCLTFQDDYGADVSIILFIGWCSAQGIRIDDRLLNRVEQSVGVWNRDVVAPLREMRRELKLDSRGITRKKVSDFREMLKALELEAEHLELNALADLVSYKSISSSSVVNEKQLIETGLLQYVEKIGFEIIDVATRQKITEFVECATEKIDISS